MGLRLSTPSLGITKRGRFSNLMRGLYGAFNSLSWDHTSSPSCGQTCAFVKLSTPSLGITMFIITGRQRKWSFNSLSRDHGRQGLDGRVRRRKVGLSTPSLGITVGEGNKSAGVGDFQLPLSGSPSTNAAIASLIASASFNSLSRDHRARFRDFPALRGFLPRRPFAQMNFETTI